MLRSRFEDQICLAWKEILECAHHLNCALRFADRWVAFWLFILVGFVSPFSSRPLPRPNLPEQVLSNDPPVLVACKLVLNFITRTPGSVLTIHRRIFSVVHTLHREGEHYSTHGCVELLFTVSQL